MDRYIQHGDPTHLKEFLVLGVVMLIALGAAVYLSFANIKNREGSVEPVACTLEAKLCPDGSYVGRTGPNCEFAECPFIYETNKVYTRDLKVGDRVNGFLVQNIFSPTGDKVNKVLDPSKFFAIQFEGVATVTIETVKDDFYGDWDWMKIVTIKEKDILPVILGGNSILEEPEVRISSYHGESKNLIGKKVLIKDYWFRSGIPPEKYQKIYLSTDGKTLSSAQLLMIIDEQQEDWQTYKAGSYKFKYPSYFKIQQGDSDCHSRVWIENELNEEQLDLIFNISSKGCFEIEEDDEVYNIINKPDFENGIYNSLNEIDVFKIDKNTTTTIVYFLDEKYPGLTYFDAVYNSNSLEIDLIKGILQTVERTMD